MNSENRNWWWIENIVTLLCASSLVLGLYAMGAGLSSFMGLFLLLNINLVDKIKGEQG